MKFRINCDLDLKACLTSGQVFRWRQVDEAWWGVDNAHWFKVLQLVGGLEVETDSDEVHFRRLFNLDMIDEQVEREVIEAEPVMAEMIAPLRGLRMMQPDDAVETFYCFLCTANNHLLRIGPMCRKLGEYGPSLGHDLYAFPSTETLLEVPEARLREQGFGYRAATIRAAASEVLARGGDAYIWSLRNKPYQTAFEELLSIPNIGSKLADCIALFGLHHGQAVPIDTHLWQAATRVFFPQFEGQALTELKYRIVGDFFRERFGKNAGWAHQRLYVDNLRRPRTKKFR